MPRIGAVLLDLDDTLVSTSKLQVFRENKDMDGLLENINKSKIYSPVKEILDKIKSSGIPLGLITNSPRWYTEKILAYHNIDQFDVVIYYDDVGAGGKKPSPQGINLALEKLGLKSNSNVIYIGDQESDFIAAYLAGIKPIAPSWAKRDPISQIPAAIVNSKHLIESLDNIDELLLIADRTAVNQSFDFPKSQLNFIPLNENGELVPLNRENVKLISFGRYFSQNSTLTARLHENHQLSKDIFKKEESSSYTIPQYYIELMSRAVETLPVYVFNDPCAYFDIITVVPAKSGKNPRLENMLTRISRVSSVKSEFIKDLFEFAPGAESLKTLGGKDRRLQELRNTLKIKEKYVPQIQGKSVLVLDDIITTGATFIHSFALLEESGANFTFGACLAKTVSVREEIKLCPECNRLMSVRKNKSTGIHFYGCSGYHEPINKCRHAEDIKVKKCPQCDDWLVTRANSQDGSHFLACEGYRKAHNCKYTESVEDV
ncbi:HAD-IA family hydrolase [Vibrio parahaemolyticus]|nr:HAD-IA family hydrolase [Vibrio parahaemolyticus]EJG1296111.1 HAD-IA family hydrolase [Vibrio parahaemolyticus]EJG1329207.1 HAD-IA family hydrolase [Vibrio parahaemolyticus]MCF9341185.1 HAD-IA family hydrolase [Vibrio parahaemolyticus]MCF9346830.1 HAD-IA family hydrolase [Vibrio parahaemolyticus]